MNRKVKELKELIKQSIKQIKSSEEFKRFLNFCSNFHSYSANNLMLIYMQKPDATVVAGLKTWNRVGRRVKKGEKGIAILAPLHRRVKEVVETIVDPETGEEVEIVEEKQELAGFKTVYVWDISQTTGKPLPVFARPLQGDADYETVKAFVEACYCPVVETDNTGVAHGWTDYEKITINRSMSKLHKSKTLFHELAHFVLHRKADYGKNRKEFEAECTAYLVMKKLGFDTSDYSFKYLAVFSELSDREFEEAMETAVKASDRIFEEFQQFYKQHAA